MNKYAKALRARRRALQECERARRQLNESVDDVVVAYQARPLPVLAGAAGIGFVLARFPIGSGLLRAGTAVASGPAWHLARQVIARMG